MVKTPVAPPWWCPSSSCTQPVQTGSIQSKERKKTSWWVGD
jgi:hypothetical protein